jgi:hypothetical protein
MVLESTKCCCQFMNQKIFVHRFFKKLRIKFGRDETVVTSSEPSPCFVFPGTEGFFITLHVFRTQLNGFTSEKNSDREHHFGHWSLRASRCETLLGYGDWIVGPRFLARGTSRSSVVRFTPRPFYLRAKSPCYTLDRRLGGPQM